MNQARKEAIHISNKYKVQIEPLHFEWDRFIPILEKEFPDILNEMLSCNSQQQQLNSNENRSMTNRNREQYNNFRRGTNNMTKPLTKPSVKMTHPNMENSFIISCTVHLKQLTPVIEMVISETTLTKKPKLEDMHITPNHSEQETHHMNNMAFTIQGNSG